jgi:hypothetical protein
MLRWIKAHVGYEGNERADQMAKRGSSGQIDVLGTDIEPPVRQARVRVNEELEKRWNSEWQHRKEARQTKIFFPGVDKNKTKALLSLTRPACGRMVRYLTGHAFLRRHQTLVFGSGDERCRFCREDPEEPQHLILSCPRLSRIRLEYFYYPGGIVPESDAPLLKIWHIWSFLQKLGDIEDEDRNDF